MRSTETKLSEHLQQLCCCCRLFGCERRAVIAAMDQNSFSPISVPEQHTFHPAPSHPSLQRWPDSSSNLTPDHIPQRWSLDPDSENYVQTLERQLKDVVSNDRPATTPVPHTTVQYLESALDTDTDTDAGGIVEEDDYSRDLSDIGDEYMEEYSDDDDAKSSNRYHEGRPLLSDMATEHRGDFSKNSVDPEEFQPKNYYPSHDEMAGNVQFNEQVRIAGGIKTRSHSAHRNPWPPRSRRPSSAPRRKSGSSILAPARDKMLSQYPDYSTMSSGSPVPITAVPRRMSSATGGSVGTASRGQSRSSSPCSSIYAPLRGPSSYAPSTSRTNSGPPGSGSLFSSLTSTNVNPETVGNSEQRYIDLVALQRRQRLQHNRRKRRQRITRFIVNTSRKGWDAATYPIRRMLSLFRVEKAKNKTENDVIWGPRPRRWFRVRYWRACLMDVGRSVRNPFSRWFANSPYDEEYADAPAQATSTSSS